MADTKKLHNKLNIDGEEYLIQASGASYLDADIELTVKSDTVEWGKTQFGSEANPTAIVDVKGGAATANPPMDGAATPGVANKFAREDHVHPTDTTRAPNDHADESTKYGLAETGKYGHAKSASEMPLTDSTTTKNTGGQIGSQVAVFARADHIHPRHEHLYASSQSEGGPADSVKATHKIAYTKATGDNDIPATNNFNKTYNGSAELVVTIPNASGTALTAGFITGKNQKKLDEIADGAEVNQNAFGKVKVGATEIVADQKVDTLTLAAGDNVTLTPDATNDKVTIATATYTAENGVTLSDYKIRADLKAYNKNAAASSQTLAASENRLYPVQLDSAGDLAVSIPWTDTAVSEVGKHYVPVQSGTYTANADSSSTATWGSTDFVTGVTLNKDGAGHITGMSVSAKQFPANPNTAPTFSGTEGVEVAKADASNKPLSIDANTVNGKINYRAALRNYTANGSASTKDTSTKGGLYAIELDKDGKLAVRVPWTDTDTRVTAVDNHYDPTTNASAQLSVDANSSTAASWNSTCLVTGVNIQRDAKGHVTGVTVDSIKMPKNPNTDNAHAHSVGDGLSISGAGGLNGTTTYSLKTATSGEIGGVKTGFTTNNTNRNYAVQLDGNNKAYVNVPWEAEQTADVFYGAGSGITMSTNTQGSRSDPHLFSHYTPITVASTVAGSDIKTVNSVTFDGYGHVTGFTLRDMTKAATGTLGVAYLHGATDCTTYTSDDGGITPLALRKALTGSANKDATTQNFIATATNTGVVKSATTGTTSGRDYNVQVNTDGTMKVNVPWLAYTAGTGISLSGTTFSNSGVRSITQDSSDGHKLSINTGGTTSVITIPDNNTHNSHAIISGTNSSNTNITGSASSSNITLGDSGVTAGTYRRVTVNSKGIVIGGDNSDTDTHHTYALTLQGNGTTATTFSQNAAASLNIKPGSNVTVTAGTNEITIASSYNNQRVKVGTSTFGANDTVNFVGGTNISVTANTTNDKITIATTSTIEATTFKASSDKRLKENIQPYTCTKSILDLPIKRFDFIDGPKNQIGCIAQDLLEICPDLVSTNEQTGMLSIQESKLVYLLIEEVRKLKKAIKSN